MKLCRVSGKCWSTVLDEQLTGSKFLLAREVLSSGTLKEEIIVALDDLGAAEGDTVLIAEGNTIPALSGKPADAVIIAIVERYVIKDEIS